MRRELPDHAPFREVVRGLNVHGRDLQKDGLSNVIPSDRAVNVVHGIEYLSGGGSIGSLCGTRGDLIRSEVGESNGDDVVYRSL